MPDIKTCVACQEPHYKHKLQQGRCVRCFGEKLALDRLARDMGEAERLRKQADRAFAAIKNQFDTFSENSDTSKKP
jgi:thiamine biosynthesis lipoprotein ApbE